MSSHKTEVIILTRDFYIQGEIDLIQGARITDFMNEAQRFLVVTNVVVSDRNGEEILRGEFINVQVANIEIVLPVEHKL